MGLFNELLKTAMSTETKNEKVIGKSGGNIEGICADRACRTKHDKMFMTSQSAIPKTRQILGESALSASRGSRHCILTLNFATTAID